MIGGIVIEHKASGMSPVTQRPALTLQPSPLSPLPSALAPSRGFTLIEILVVIVVIAVLVGLVV